MPPPLLAQQTHSLKDGYNDLHDDDEDHDDDVDDDEDVLNQMKNLPTIPPLA